jgi:predicted glycoside hydrolase/deacetylase ChbG (UPF0249 family)
MAAQVARALAAGIDVTHIDMHMGTIIHPKFIGSYVQLALRYRVPAMILRTDEAGYRSLGMDNLAAAFAAKMVAELEAQGLALIDSVAMLSLDQPEERVERAKQALSNLPPGITHFVIHPSLDTAELRAIAPDWRCRVADYHTFTDEAFRKWVRSSGIEVIGYREIQEAMRS